MSVTHVCQRCGEDFSVLYGDTDAFCDDCAYIEDGECPCCQGEIWRESVHNGVAIIYGPYGCNCGWSEWPEYDCRNGPREADQWGGITPS